MLRMRHNCQWSDSYFYTNLSYQSIIEVN